MKDRLLAFTAIALGTAAFASFALTPATFLMTGLPGLIMVFIGAWSLR